MNLSINHDYLIERIFQNKTLTWVGWNFNDQQLDGTLNKINYSKRSAWGVYSRRARDHKSDLYYSIPQLCNIDFDIEKSHITKIEPGGSLPWHKDYNRSKALLIPIGVNKGKLHYENEELVYLGPTVIITNKLHRIVNNTDFHRYSIQLHLSD